jgi:hypothetical protein
MKTRCLEGSRRRACVIITCLLAVPAVFLLGTFSPRAQTTAHASAPGKLIARVYNSGFAKAHDTYNGMGTGSDGKIYYVLSSDLADTAARMFSLDPATGQTRQLGDLTEACGEKGMNAVAQGKSHVNFVEADGRLYFATHIGYYSIIDGMEKSGVPPAGMKAYPGGHLLAYDLSSGKFENLAVEPHGEGIITMNMDPRRRRIYGITWPAGYFFRYDLASKNWKSFGSLFEMGENGKGASYRTICRSLAVDPGDGSVYFSTPEGTIYRYSHDKDTLESVVGDNLKKDYFGLYDVTSPGHMAYNWRQVFYYPADRSIYGVHGNSGYLFRFDPGTERVEVLERITSLPSQRSGMFDQFSYGYLGFTLGPDHQTIYYLTGGPIYVNGRRVKGKDSTAAGEAKGQENLHLITYHIPTARYVDHGPIFFENGEHPTYVNSIAVGKDGTVYTLVRIPQPAGGFHTDLISVIPDR